MDDPKALELFHEVLRKTLAKKLAWEPTADDETFVASMLAKYKLALTSYTSRNNWGDYEGPPVVRLQDERGSTLVEINSDINGITALQLQNLFVFAKRIALNADEKIDELLQELKRDE